MPTVGWIIERVELKPVAVLRVESWLAEKALGTEVSSSLGVISLSAGVQDENGVQEAVPLTVMPR